MLDAEVVDPNSNIVDVCVVKEGARELAVDKGVSVIPGLLCTYIVESRGI